MANFPFYSDLDLNNNQLFKSRWENLSSAPSSPGDARFYFDTTTKLFRGWNGTNWSNFNNGFSSVGELVVASSSTSINLASGTMFNLTLTGNTTISAISGIPSGVQGISFTLRVIQNSTGSHLLSFPSNVALTGVIDYASNKTSIINFASFDGGTSWEAIVIKPQYVPVSGTLWTPAQLTTALWLDAGDASTISIGSGVSQWGDKSGNNRHPTQGTASTQPALISGGLNGLNTIRLDGSNDILNLPATISTVRFAFVVFKYQAQGGSWKPLFGNPVISGWDADWQGSGNGTDLFDAGFTHANILNGEKRVNGTVTTGVLSRYTSFTILTVKTTGNVNVTNLSADRPSNFGDRFSNIEFAEIVLLSSEPSSSDIQKLEGYSAYKWGLQSSLPSGHLYKTSPPTI